jgi:hypothetical protein
MNLTRTAVVSMMVLAGCGGGGVEDAEQTGQVELKLAGQAASGVTYRLRQAIVMVQGPQNTIFFDTEENPNRTSLSADVPPGNYFTWLQEGWRLDRLNVDGTATTVQAQLLSPNPTYFDVYPQQRTPVVLRFRAGADDVTMDQGAFDIVLDVEEAPTTSTICSNDSECGAGQTCCLAGFLGTCTSLAPGATCPLPDLTVSADTAQSSIFINHEVFPADSCAIAERCVDAPGDRRLLRFSTQTPNIGAADMILGDPSLVPDFEFSSCHGHYHFEGYARYELVDSIGAVVATGRKQAFCLLDSNPVGLPGAPTSPRYHCGFQGIQRGWSDIYGAGLDCQWVDITNVPSGDYLLRIMINPDGTLPESNYDNNVAEIPVFVPEEGLPPVPGDPLSDCVGGGAGPGRDCGWAYAAGYEGHSCIPGEPINVGCGCSIGGACVGDPMLRVCDGSSACTAASALISMDDTCGLCPEAGFVGPPSGVYSVLVGAFSAGSAFTCDIASSAP